MANRDFLKHLAFSTVSSMQISKLESPENNSTKQVVDEKLYRWVKASRSKPPESTWIQIKTIEDYPHIGKYEEGVLFDTYGTRYPLDCIYWLEPYTPSEGLYSRATNSDIIDAMSYMSEQLNKRGLNYGVEIIAEYLKNIPKSPIPSSTVDNLNVCGEGKDGDAADVEFEKWLEKGFHKIGGDDLYRSYNPNWTRGELSMIELYLIYQSTHQ